MDDKVFGFVYTDAEGNPRLPTVSVVDPRTDPHVTEPYRFIYEGNNEVECIQAIQAAIVVQDGKATWAEANSTGSE